MNFSPEKLFLVGIIALVVLGPNRLPQAARTVGRLLAEFRRVSASMQNEFSQVMAEPRDAMQKSVGEFGLTDVRSQLRNTITEVVTGPGPVNGAPIIDPSKTLEVSALAEPAPTPASELRGAPVVPDDPSFN
ncbi:MAG: twin-arginine translocase TatA/TatE family subunit [Acidimicrobiaceae bacterium]|nr:twin-arginine translocase TatA/TatE family subunit [Acidimicrobiaceae bacterium]